MLLLDNYLAARQKVFDYFDYMEGWRILPIDDARGFYWRLDGTGPGVIKFAETARELAREVGKYYEFEIYTNRHLKQWVYRAERYTMVVVDTQTDGNQLLMIFDNEYEQKE